jgi:hypothetical protein
MKKVLAGMSKFVAAGFAIAMLGLLMSLTYAALQRIFTDNFANQIWGLVLFDIAAMAWALTFVFQSRSVGQYASAGIGFLVGFIGTLGMVAAEVMLSGQDLAQIDTAQIGRWMIYGFIGATALHAALVYIHHMTSPEISEQISVGIARGEVVSEAISNATKTIEAEKHQLSQAIYNDIVSQVKRDLGLHPIQDTVFDRRQRYELNVTDIPSPVQQEQPAPIPEEVKKMYAPGTRFIDGTSNPPATQEAVIDEENNIQVTMPANIWKSFSKSLQGSGIDPAAMGSKPTEAANSNDRPLSQRFRDFLASLRQPAATGIEPAYHPVSLDPTEQHGQYGPSGSFDPNDRDELDAQKEANDRTSGPTENT